MRILHGLASLDPADGGLPKIAVRLAAAQAALGHDVHILGYRRPMAEAAIDQELRAIPHASQLRLTFLSPADARERLTGLRARRAVSDMIGDFDFLHLHDLWLPLSRVAAAAAFRRGVPYTLLLNGMLDPWSLAQKRWKKRMGLFVLGYRKMLDRAAFLHAGNDDEVRLIRPMRLKPEVCVIPNGIFVEELSPLPPAGSFARSHPELRSRPYVLFLSRLHYKKGLDYLADAFAKVARRLPDIMLVVAGPDGGAEAEFRRRVAALRIADRVVICGPVWGNDRLAAMADAACFCLPSHQEGFSLAITEAMGCGLPVVVSEGCHYPQVAQAGAGFVLPLDADVFADALVRVMSDADLRTTMGRAGRDLVSSRFTWPLVAEQTIKAYERVRRARGRRNSAGGEPEGVSPSLRI
jgi:glycosyltransferase involved in cell wall biosynthesis